MRLKTASLPKVLGAALGLGWLLALTGCDQLKERAGIQDPAKIEAEGKAIGSACRQAGWGIEDCFRLNPDASKPAVFTGWKEMNEYMLENNMQAMEPTVSESGLPIPARRSTKQPSEGETADMAKEGHAGKQITLSGEKPVNGPTGSEISSGSR